MEHKDKRAIETETDKAKEQAEIPQENMIEDNSDSEPKDDICTDDADKDELDEAFEEEEEVDLEKVRIMIVTAEKIIAGDLQLPAMEVTENPTPESLLFYALNCGNQFLALRNCSIMDKDNTEFEPERVKFFVVNINIVESCRIIPKDTKKTSVNRQYNMNETI